MQALAAGWLSFAFWNVHEVELAIGHAREALRRAAPDDHKARARVCLVIAEIFALAADEERARVWFASARRHATAAGDDASKSALSFNMSVVQGMPLRQASLSSLGQANPRRAELHRAVSENVGAALGVPDDERTLMERARLFSLLDRPEEALELYRDHPLPDDGFRYREWPVWLADEAWCRCRLGETERALELADAAERLLDGSTQIDDLACVQAMLAKVYAAAGDEHRAALNAALADEAWCRYADRQAAWASLCAAITENG
jgi:tetratricopeptide (TPR) repeat protein